MSFSIPGLEQDAGQRGIAWFVLRQHHINGKLDTVRGFDIAGLHKQRHAVVRVDCRWPNVASRI